MLSKHIKKIPYALLKHYAISQIRKRKCWYVDIPRTSSTSLKAELSKAYGVAYGKQNTNNELYSYPQVFQDHLPATHMRKVLGKELWSSINTFSIVRNPWDRMVSIFEYRKQTGELESSITFKNYLQYFNNPYHGLKQSPHYYHGYFYSCMDYLTDEKNNIIVKDVGRYEDRASFLKEISPKLSLNTLGNIHLQQSSNKKHYSTYYDKETKELIARIFRRDVLAFGYKFE